MPQEGRRGWKVGKERRGKISQAFIDCIRITHHSINDRAEDGLYYITNFRGTKRRYINGPIGPNEGEDVVPSSRKRNRYGV